MKGEGSVECIETGMVIVVVVHYSRLLEVERVGPWVREHHGLDFETRIIDSILRHAWEADIDAVELSAFSWYTN